MVVEDDKDQLFTIALLLELHRYEVIQVSNAEVAIKIMQEENHIPELILSDIIMPDINGYQFLKMVAKSPELAQIPFIFLSAKSKPDDIHLGKLLGADDYIGKPFTEEKLLQKIEKRLQTQNKGKYIEDNVAKKMYNKKDSTIIERGFINEIKNRESNDKSENTYFKELLSHNKSILMIVNWNDTLGPFIEQISPSNLKKEPIIYELSNQLYDSSVGIYGKSGFYGAEGLLLKIKNIQQDGYLFFDAYETKSTRGGELIFMIALIAPKIHYLASLQIKEIFSEISSKIKNDKKYSIEIHHKYIKEILEAI